MAIDGRQRGQLVPGTRLTARFKGEEYGAAVVEGEGGRTRYRLDDGREFRSPSAAGTAVMGGTACNGWRFWSVVEPSSTPTALTAKPRSSRGKPE